MSVRLAELVRSTRESLAERMRARPLEEVQEEAAGRSDLRPFREALVREPGTSVIAEHKRRSPSAGAIREDSSVGEIVRAYEQGGAVALSILTDERHFGGSLEHLREARAASELPILRKDFNVDPYQLHEAKAAGADAVLLIVGALTAEELASLYGETRALGLEALVEVHDEQELAAALEVGAETIGINNRDLEDFSLDISRTYDLLTGMPEGKAVVSESGIVYREQVEELDLVGVHAVLVGEPLMRAPDPEAAVRELTGGGDGEEPS